MFADDPNRHISNDGSSGNTDSALGSRCVEDRHCSIHVNHIIANVKDSNATQLIVRQTSYSDDSPDGIDCVSLCSAVSNPTKRGLERIESRNTLVKRVFDPWPPLDSTDKGKDKFMVDACNALKPEQDIVPDWASQSPGYASAVSAPFGNTAFRYGMQQICGCTMLFVVSRKRVYLGKCLQILAKVLCNVSVFSGHYWEDVSFGKEKGAKYKLQFDEQVTNFLTNGFTAPGRTGRLCTKSFALLC